MNRRELLSNVSKAACLTMLPIPNSLFRDKIEFRPTNSFVIYSPNSQRGYSSVEDIYVNGTFVGSHYRHYYDDSYLNSLSEQRRIDQRIDLISGTIKIVVLPKIIISEYTAADDSKELICIQIRKILNLS